MCENKLKLQVSHRIGFLSHKCASSLFYKKFKNTLSVLATYNIVVLILGDFNFHLEQPDKTDAQTVLNILRSDGFDSSTNQPTHNQEDGSM